MLPALRNHAALLAAGGAWLVAGRILRPLRDVADTARSITDTDISRRIPLGPGAEPMDRLLAFGRSRLEMTLRSADLIRAAGRAGTHSYAAYSFVAMHVRHLLGELGVTGDLPLLATALMAPLEVPILEQQVRIEGIDVDRVHRGWEDLVHRITQK